MAVEIIDVSDRKPTGDEWRQLVGTGKICRLSKDQFQSVVPANKADYASKVWDLYSSMPVGTYYMTTAHPFHARLTAQEVEQNGSPCQWFSRKRFEGFTTAIPFVNAYSFDCTPDREVYVPWELLGPSDIRLRESSSLFDEMVILDKKGVREAIDKNYAEWQRLFPTVVSEDAREEVRSLIEDHHFTLRDLSEARGRNYQTPDDVYRHLMEDLELPIGFRIDSILPHERAGYAPEVNEVHSPTGLSNFIIRYLSFQDKGIVLPARAVA